MTTQALICYEDQSFELAEVELPEPGEGQLQVRTLYSGVSIGTEFSLIRGRLDWGPYPICTGYQGVGVVERIGPATDGFAVGDKVYYRNQVAMRLSDGRPVTPVCGTHAAHAVTALDPHQGPVLMPPGVPDDVGSCFVMPAVGLVGVDMSNPRVAETVLVYGAGAIGLAVVAALALRGCTVIAVDLDAARLEVARRLGADYVIDASVEDVAAAVRRIAPNGADTVFEATGNRECVGPAIALCKPEGKFVWQGNYGRGPMPFEFLPAHSKRLVMFFPCDDGWKPNRRAVLKNIASGALRWAETITHRVEASDAPTFFHQINQGTRRDVISSVIHWSD